MHSFLLLLAIVFPQSLPVMNGNEGESYSFDSVKVRVVEAYFNTCPYCNYNAPNVDEIAEEFQEIDVLDVGIDRNDSDYENWVAKHHPNHPVLKDARRELIGKLGTTGYPSTYVLGCDNEIVFKTSGQWSQTTKKKIKSAIEKALQSC